MRSALVFILSLAGVAVATNTTETAHTRKYFYTGGQYIGDDSGGHTYTDQLYVEQLTPVGGATKDAPIVFIHGQAQTGTVSRPASHFLASAKKGTSAQP